ncbi:MAG: hypothetical protein CMN06_06025 [Roseibacillus sp.]|nr:hypothetical protein [Roseibacillus sp.]
MRISFCALACLILPAGLTGAEEILVPAGEQTEWRYLESGAAPGENWNSSDFDDSGWRKGTAPLGYGKEGLGTVIRFGDDPANKPITAYFRKTFKVGPAEKHDFAELGLSATYDDGVAIYLNGKEVARDNLEAGKLTARSRATRAIRESSELSIKIPVARLKYGALNTIAVEVHQAGPTSSDLYLDLKLSGLEEGERPVLDPYREGMRALQRGDAEEGSRLLSQMPQDHPEYARTMAMLGWQVYAEGLGEPKRGLPFVKKAYEVAPTDRQVVRSYIKTHVLSGVLFDPAAIARERKKDIAAEHKFLVTKPELREAKLVSRKDLEEDLDYLEHVLMKCFSYLELRPVDYQGALDAIRGSLDEETSLNQFRLQLAKLISLFCDGHARLASPPSQYMPRGYAPFVAGSYKDRVYLVDGESFVDPKHPYVTSIDGRPIAEWLEVASYTVVKESPQWRLRQSLQMLGYVNYIRAELGLPAKETILLELESKNRKSSRKLEVEVARRPQREAEFPEGNSRRIGEVGYIRLPQMTGSSRFLAQLNQLMRQFKDTRGMIIDVRGNPGGSKNILLTLMPYFLKPGDPMRIIEFSAYRKPMELPKPMPDGFNMSSMSAQPVTSSHWKTEDQRKYIGDAIKAFKPTWVLPEGKFSDFYVLAFDSTMNPEAYYYEKPLIILQDSGSFSASDIFLGGFKGLPNTTLMGTASGGGNGWMDSYTLPKTGLEVVLCQTAKFRPSGEPFDGLGVPPDVVMEATPRDRMGKSDSVLDAALLRLAK